MSGNRAEGVGRRIAPGTSATAGAVVDRANPGNSAPPAATPSELGLDLARRAPARVPTERAEPAGAVRARRADLPPPGAPSAGPSAAPGDDTVQLEQWVRRTELAHRLVTQTSDPVQAVRLVVAALPAAKQALEASTALARHLPSAAQLSLQLRMRLPLLVYNLAARRLVHIEDEVRNRNSFALDSPQDVPLLEGAIAELERLKAERNDCGALVREARRALETRAAAELMSGEYPLLGTDEEQQLVMGTSSLYIHLMMLNLYRVVSFEGLPKSIHDLLGDLLAAGSVAARASTQLSSAARETGAVDEAARKRSLDQIDQVHCVADRFAETVVQDWNGPETHWKGVLALASAMREVLALLRHMTPDLPPRELPHDAARGEPSAHARTDAQTDARPATDLGTPAAAAGRPAPQRRARTRRAGRRLAEATAPVAAEAPSARDAALKRFGQLMRERPLTPDLASRFDGDPAAIARAMGKDSAALELMRTRGRDPIAAASMARTSAEWWFGRAAPLQALRQELAGALQAHPGDAELGDAITQLDGRLDALAQVDARVRADEADALKRHAFPRASHLQRMLDLGEIARVDRPTRLDAEGDVGHLGTLFELAVRLKPLGDGTAAQPLFLHLHAATPVSAEACTELPADQVEALHVKTAAQRGLGARWEQMQRALGHDDAKVHRGRVDAPLLKALREIGAP